MCILVEIFDNVEFKNFARDFNEIQVNGEVANGELYYLYLCCLRFITNKESFKISHQTA